ncbi:MAG: response regulator [Candidatus Zixiibacteriota bacterium]|nr:MAG: response regulator [candidate division Zixibacteria bacterium]
MTEPKKILIVDDELDVIEWMTAFFEDNGYATISAVNGVEAFALAKSDKPDLVTLDISMDQESGMRALKNLQKTEETKDIPIIICTGVSPDLKRFIDRTKQLNTPAAFMEKPIDRDALLSKVKELIG